MTTQVKRGAENNSPGTKPANRYSIRLTICVNWRLRFTVRRSPFAAPGPSSSTALVRLPNVTRRAAYLHPVVGYGLEPRPTNAVEDEDENDWRQTPNANANRAARPVAAFVR